MTQLELLCFRFSFYCLWACIWFYPDSVFTYVRLAILLPLGGLDWASQSTPGRTTHSSRSPCRLHRVTFDSRQGRLANRWCIWQITGGPKYFPEELRGWLATRQTTCSHNMCTVSYQWCKSKSTHASSHINQPQKACVTEVLFRLWAVSVFPNHKTLTRSLLRGIPEEGEQVLAILSCCTDTKRQGVSFKGAQRTLVEYWNSLLINDSHQNYPQQLTVEQLQHNINLQLS